MDALGTTAVFGRVKPLEQASFRPQMEDFQSPRTNSSLHPASGSAILANSLTQLLETARRELDRDPEVARASLAGASALSCKRRSSATRAPMAPWGWSGALADAARALLYR